MEHSSLFRRAAAIPIKHIVRFDTICVEQSQPLGEPNAHTDGTAEPEWQSYQQRIQF